MFVHDLLSCFSVQLHDKYNEFVTPSEKEEFLARLQEVEDWLYEDGEDETKSVYVAKLKELKTVRSLYFFNYWPLSSLLLFSLKWKIFLCCADCML